MRPYRLETFGSGNVGAGCNYWKLYCVAYTLRDLIGCMIDSVFRHMTALRHRATSSTRTRLFSMRNFDGSGIFQLSGTDA